MSVDPNLSTFDMMRMRDLGAAVYLSAYVHLLARNLGIDDKDHEAINAFASALVEPVNLAAEAAFRALVNDRAGSDELMDQLREQLSTLA